MRMTSQRTSRRVDLSLSPYSTLSTLSQRDDIVATCLLGSSHKNLPDKIDTTLISSRGSEGQQWDKSLGENPVHPQDKGMDPRDDGTIPRVNVKFLPDVTVSSSKGLLGKSQWKSLILLVFHIQSMYGLRVPILTLIFQHNATNSNFFSKNKGNFYKIC